MKNSILCSPNSQSIMLSIGLHLLMVGLAYFTRSVSGPGVSTGQIYRVGLQSTIAYMPKKNETAQNELQQHPQVAHELKETGALIAKTKLKHSGGRPHRSSQNKRSSAKKEQKMAKSHAPHRIDERGLYKTTKSGAKQTGTSLELRGWEWDVAPNPNDTTEECGKIVFEIKVDQNGELISIQTIEKTVTPMVEKIYADALRALTFSKTVDHASPISTGKVTFILVAK